MNQTAFKVGHGKGMLSAIVSPIKVSWQVMCFCINMVGGCIVTLLVEDWELVRACWWEFDRDFV